MSTIRLRLPPDGTNPSLIRRRASADIAGEKANISKDFLGVKARQERRSPKKVTSSSTQELYRFGTLAR
jgi:hypothetical protein